MTNEIPAMSEGAHEANQRGESYQPARPARYRFRDVEAIRWDGTDEGFAAVRVFTGSPVQSLTEPGYQGVVIDTHSIFHLWDFENGGYILPSGLHIEAPYQVRCLVLLPVASTRDVGVAVPGDYIVRSAPGVYAVHDGDTFERAVVPA